MFSRRRTHQAVRGVRGRAAGPAAADGAGRGAAVQPDLQGGGRRLQAHLLLSVQAAAQEHPQRGVGQLRGDGGGAPGQAALRGALHRNRPRQLPARQVGHTHSCISDFSCISEVFNEATT